jgi:hypothetical protein
VEIEVGCSSTEKWHFGRSPLRYTGQGHRGENGVRKPPAICEGLQPVIIGRSRTLGKYRNEKSSHRRMNCSFVSVLCLLLPAREVLRYDPKTRTTSRFRADLIPFESKHPTYSKSKSKFFAALRLWALLPLLTEVGIHKCLS